jgi:hypothetical protein
MRNAMIQYRTLFDALMGTTAAGSLAPTPAVGQRIVA